MVIRSLALQVFIVPNSSLYVLIRIRSISSILLSLDNLRSSLLAVPVTSRLIVAPVLVAFRGLMIGR
ncbi:hypothetical protein DL96DRAFT_1599945 [Flagelloscypha sp. PMI_526]|nr:hypothetical protein DL96DRAFT_1599945 [Flagelloscypha sp. PMI_526]